MQPNRRNLLLVLRVFGEGHS